jgi:hypothetical protein
VLFALASRSTLLNRFIPIVEIPPKIQDRISFQQANTLKHRHRRGKVMRVPYLPLRCT